jgi:hypothetical protein
MSYNMMIGYDIYDCFTMEHFRLRQRMTLTTKIYCSWLYIKESCGIQIYLIFAPLWYQNQIEKQRLCKSINDRFLIKDVVR